MADERPLERNALHDWWARKARERGQTADRVIEKVGYDPLLSFAPAVPVTSRCPRFVIADAPHRAIGGVCVHCGVATYDPAKGV